MTCYSVSQLNNLARTLLNETFGEEAWVVGEVQGYRMHDRSGHAYFDIVEKDTNNPGQYIAKISCAFFRGAFIQWRSRLKKQSLGEFSLSDGIEIKVRASVELYVKEGKYQLIVNDVDASYSLGAMARRRQQTIDELKKAGLMEKNKGLSFGECPLRIGLITSSGSAAFKDFLSVLNSSGYAFKVFLFDAYMQGEQTSRDILKGIAALEKKDLDAIAVIRGGGSRTDLSYFDDMAICTAIAKARYPVMTGIGHEIDLSVADMVANRHFVTPTDTARFFKSLIDEFFLRIQASGNALSGLSKTCLNSNREGLKVLTYRLTSEVSRLERASKEGLYHMAQNIIMSAVRDLSENRNTLDVFIRSIQTGARMLVRNSEAKLDEKDNLISALDPSSTLRRGFSITIGPEALVLTEATKLRPGDRIKTVLYKGSFNSAVLSKELK